MNINIDNKQKFLSDSIPYFKKYGVSLSSVEKVSLELYDDINYHTKLFSNLRDLLDFYFLVEGNKFSSKLLQIKVTKSDKISDLVFQAVMLKLDLVDKKLLEQIIKYLSTNFTSHNVALDSLYRSSDIIWSWLGSNNIDFSYYSKRISLSIVISSTIVYSLAFKTDEDLKRFLKIQLKSFSSVGRLKNKVCSFFDNLNV